MTMKQMFRIKKALDTANTINTGINLGMDIVNQKAKLINVRKKYEQDSQQIMMPDDEMMQSDQLFKHKKKCNPLMINLVKCKMRLIKNCQAVAAGDTEAKEDILNKYIQSYNTHKIDLKIYLANANRLAELQD